MEQSLEKSTLVRQSIIAGITATVAMTIFALMAPIMGMPEMNPPVLLSDMLGVPLAIGWLMHFMIGIIFAFAYAFIFLGFLAKMSSLILRGVIFGIAIFIFAQVMMAIMGALIGGMPMPESNIMLMMTGSLVGHIVYGIVVALIVKNN